MDFSPCSLHLDLFTWDSDAADLGAELLPLPICSFAPASSQALVSDVSSPALGSDAQQPPCILDSDVEDLPEESQDTTPKAPALESADLASACSRVKFLKASSGVVHAAIWQKSACFVMTLRAVRAYSQPVGPYPQSLA